MELDGHILRKGTRLQLGIGAANHDPDEFPNPEQLDFSRPKVSSLAFGYGPHFCLGAALARLETQVALSRLLDRIPQVQLGTRTFRIPTALFLAIAEISTDYHSEPMTGGPPTSQQRPNGRFPSVYCQT
jgi:cytochrome P450